MPAPKLTWETVEEIRRLRYEQGWRLRDIALKFGISSTYAGMVARGEVRGTPPAAGKLKEAPTWTGDETDDIVRALQMRPKKDARQQSLAVIHSLTSSMHDLGYDIRGELAEEGLWPLEDMTDTQLDITASVFLRLTSLDISARALESAQEEDAVAILFADNDAHSQQGVDFA